jgi:hypothetical protein
MQGTFAPIICVLAGALEKGNFVLLDDADTRFRMKRRGASGRHMTRRWHPDNEGAEVVINISFSHSKRT